MRPENNTKKMCFYKFVATLLLSLTHKTSKTLQINRLHQIKNILHRYFLYRKVDYFSAHGIGGQNGQGGCGKYTLRYFGEEDFTAASVSGP